MPRKLLREAFVILVETAMLLALLAVLGLPGRRPPKAEAAVSFAETLQPQAGVRPHPCTEPFVRPGADLKAACLEDAMQHPGPN
jgi:hypothetical protein